MLPCNFYGDTTADSNCTVWVCGHMRGSAVPCVLVGILLHIDIYMK